MSSPHFSPSCRTATACAAERRNGSCGQRRPKVGFRVPVNRWFRHEWHAELTEAFTGPGSRSRDFYHGDYLQKLLRAHFDGRSNHEKILWTLFALEIFQREYNLTA
jgi:asparagine synthase (glutamine-hydrolysing)